MKKLTIGEWLENECPGYAYSVTENFASAEELLLAKSGKRGLHHSYVRYGYPLCNFFANELCSGVLRAAGLDFQEIGYQGRFYNSGMAGLATIVHAAGLARGDQIIAGRILYPETHNLLESLGLYGIEANYVNSANLDSIKKMFGAETKLILMETAGNGWGMPLLDIKGLLGFCWDKDVILVLDNTILTSLLADPFHDFFDLYVQEKKGLPRCHLVYVESGSKFYRASDADDVTLGIVLATNDFVERLDKTMCYLGTYLPQHSLKMLPVKMIEAAIEIVFAASLNARLIAQFLKKQPGVRVSRPNLHDGGPLIYARLPYKTKEEALRFVDALDCPKTGSFGHPVTTILPLFMIPDYPLNEVRIAAGWQESSEEAIEKLKKAFAAMSE